MIELYVNQDITLKKQTSVNEYNEPIFTTSTIKSRFEYDRTLVRNDKGEEIVSEASLFTTTLLTTEDIISYNGKDFPVISVAYIVGLDGNLSHYEARL